MSVCQPVPRLSRIMRNISGLNILKDVAVGGDIQVQSKSFECDEYMLAIIDEDAEVEHFDTLPMIFRNHTAAANAASDWNKSNPGKLAVVVQLGAAIKGRSTRIRLDDNAGVAEIVSYRPVRVLREDSVIDVEAIKEGAA